jgi:kinesin family protein C1
MSSSGEQRAARGTQSPEGQHVLRELQPNNSSSLMDRESIKNRIKILQEKHSRSGSMPLVNRGGENRQQHALVARPAAGRDLEKSMEALQGKLETIKQTPVLVGGRTASRMQPESVGTQATTSSSVNGLAAKLESLRQREKPSMAPSLKGEFDFQGMSTSAQQLFGDAEFAALCDKGLNAQLTRTKDGGTQETKMRELADIVKTMRRALKEMQQRTQMFVELSVRYERDARNHVDSVRLSADSAATTLSAELANVRREAATEAANYKAALANWQSQMDLLQSESATLKRENERLASEQDELKLSYERICSEKAHVENELCELKRINEDREKELQAGRNAATQTVYQVREDFERQRAELMGALSDANEKIRAAEDVKRQLNAELKISREEEERLSVEMRKVTAEFEAAANDLERTKRLLSDLQEENSKMLTELQASRSANQDVNSSLGQWQQKAADLLKELEKERSVSESLKLSAEKYADTAANNEETLKETQHKYEETLAETVKRQAELESETAALRKTVEEVTMQRQETQEALEKLNAELQEANEEVAASKDALLKLQEEASTALESIEKANQKASVAEGKLAEVQKEADEKSSKLAQLEGELEALQECTYGMEGADQKELISRMVTKIASLEAAVVAADAKRREAHNQLVELKGNIRVFCRVRPNPSSVAQIASDGSSIRVYADSKPYEFNFDKVFAPEASQSDIFTHVSDLVQSALDGYNVCLFSYGQTGAGKTHTMQGNNVPGQEGIIPRSIAKILKTVETLKEQGWVYTLEASFVEVYNEQLRDLLVEKKGAGKITENNAIQHAPNGHTIIQGATRLPISSEYDAEEIVNRAAASRAVECTAMNSTSSRSHSIFMLYISGCHEATETVLKGSLNLVDLAGSERLNRSQVEGQRAKEACSINKSLSSLGDVFAALSSKQAHIPYRNSKLTHLLQPCLGGSGKTLMFVNINPEPMSAQESLCSLRFASKVNQCETAAKGGAKRHTSIMDRGRPSIGTTGRESGEKGPASRRQSVAPTTRSESRRMSMIPSAGTKRKPMGPPPNPSSRPRFN